MRSGAAVAREIDEGKAVLRAAHLLQDHANAGELFQHHPHFLIVAEAFGKAPVEEVAQSPKTFDATGDAIADWRVFETPCGIVELAPLPPRGRAVPPFR